VLEKVAAKFKDDLAPAIERVWRDGVESVRADLREWLRLATLDDSGFVPWRFELSFGLPSDRDADPASRPEPVTIDAGLCLRGSIDLVERAGASLAQRAEGERSPSGFHLRVTDHKTGKERFEPGAVVDGGRTLQPVLYALALEQLFPGHAVAGGRLSYCTSKGGFTDVDIPLDDEARAAAGELTRTLEHHLGEAFLPAAPEEGACEYCDYLAVCGTGEELRVRRKPTDKLVRLRKLREAP